MADLIVDYQLLDVTERSLVALTGEFQHIQAFEQGYEGAVGSGSIAAAMDDFAGNWSYHREKLIGSMQSLGEMVTQTKQQFQGTDSKLASTLTRK
jgi:hypothetical protein